MMLVLIIGYARVGKVPLIGIIVNVLPRDLWHVKNIECME